MDFNHFSYDSRALHIVIDSLALAPWLYFMVIDEFEFGQVFYLLHAAYLLYILSFFSVVRMNVLTVISSSSYCDMVSIFCHGFLLPFELSSLCNTLFVSPLFYCFVRCRFVNHHFYLHLINKSYFCNFFSVG